MPQSMRSGLFLAFEGGEGAGKTTQAKLLKERLQGLGKEVVLTREPGGTALGEHLREIILRPTERERSSTDARSSLAPAAELFLFLAARAQLVSEVIRPGLEKGAIVVCDRYSASTIAYQGYGRGLDVEAVRRACDLAAGGLKPDLSILLDIPVSDGLNRKAVEGEAHDAIGGESRDFHERVRQGFQELVAAEPERWLVVDAALSPEEAARTIWPRVVELLDQDQSDSARD
ncbi:MAG: dTMP kinase [Dehalococcoidia bacterium]|jgi:dTMP kinase